MLFSSLISYPRPRMPLGFTQNKMRFTVRSPYPTIVMSCVVAVGEEKGVVGRVGTEVEIGKTTIRTGSKGAIVFARTRTSDRRVRLTVGTRHDVLDFLSCLPKASFDFLLL